MTPERWNRIEDLFSQAVEHDPGTRSAWLDKQCGTDRELRVQVERLLASDTEASPLVAAAIGASVRDFHTPSQEPQVRRIGPYEVLSEIGRGGMGVVYLARRDDDVFRKEVAIKVVKRGMDTDQILKRFLHERRVLARLEHPSIARILDGGSTGDRLPYLVMEYVQGLNLTEYCERHKLTLQERLELFVKVCEAVDYAHRSLVIHRDLKPSNILVDATGTPKLLDFGIAKLLTPDETDESTITSEGARLLTPQYASPEQISGEPITPSSDIYSLGTILYVLLTGSQAHRITTHTPISLLRAICQEEVVPPSAAARKVESPPVPPHELAGDLDNILLTALRKDRQERYGSVHLLGEDIRRFLADLPVMARPQTLRYRAVKFLRRNRMPVIAASLAAASLIAGTAVSIQQARRAERRFQEVRSLANSFLFEIHDQIETLPGSTRVRELMVRTALRYLNNLAKESSDDPTLQFELAAAYQKIGDVQGYGVRPNLGQFREAMESQKKALEIAEKLSALGYDPKVQRLLAVTHHRVGFLLQGRLSKDGTEGLAHYQKAQELLERLNRESPGDPDTSRLLIMVYGHQGDSDISRGRMAAAAENWGRTLEVAQQWMKRNPSDAAILALGIAHRRISRAAQLNGDLPKALEEARAAVNIQEPLTATQPSSTAWQRELLNSYERLSLVEADPEYISLGDRQNAIAHNKKVVAIAQALSDADPNNKMAASDLVIAMRSACDFMPEGDDALLIRTCQDALEVSARFGREESSVLPSVATRLGPALARTRRRGEAVKTMERGVQLLTRLLQDWPWRADLRLQLLRLHNQFGAILADMDDAEDALKEYRGALAIGQAMLAERAHDLVVLRDLADCYVNLGRYYEKRDPNEARQWYKKDLDVWTEWPHHAISSSFDQGRRAQAARKLQGLRP